MKKGKLILKILIKENIKMIKEKNLEIMDKFYSEFTSSLGKNTICFGLLGLGMGFLFKRPKLFAMFWTGFGIGYSSDLYTKKFQHIALQLKPIEPVSIKSNEDQIKRCVEILRN